MWNLPFECTFRSMTPYGWPQLVLYCTAKDAKGKESVRAYGCTHMPIEPGTHVKTVRMFSPIASNTCMEFFGVFKDGDGLMIDDPELIARAQGREVARVKAGGKVTLSISITERNMKNHGFICSTRDKDE